LDWVGAETRSRAVFAVPIGMAAGIGAALRLLASSLQVVLRRGQTPSGPFARLPPRRHHAVRPTKHTAWNTGK